MFDLCNAYLCVQQIAYVLEHICNVLYAVRTSFYHSLARQEGSKEYWQQKVVNYLFVPNPINTCQRHLGLMIRSAARNLHRSFSPDATLTPGASYMLLFPSSSQIRQLAEQKCPEHWSLRHT